MHVITVLRNYLGYTQVRLSKEAGITQPDLSEMEKLEPYGYIDKYIRVGKVLGIPVDCLLKNDFTTIPESFFDARPPQEYRPATASPEGIMGREGEDYIFAREQARLRENFPALAKLVLPLYKMRGYYPGYDILSFDDFGRPICLEVKTSSSLQISCRFSPNEFEMAKKLTKEGEDYRVVMVQGWDTEEMWVQDVPYAELMRDYRVEPVRYNCYPIPAWEKRPMNGIGFFRRLRGLRQADLAEELGVTPSNFSLYETGDRRPPVETYLRLSDLLDASVDELIASYDASDLAEVG